MPRSDIVRSMLSRTFDLMNEIGRTSNRAALDEIVLNATRRYGVTHQIVGITPAVLPRVSEQPSLILSGAWPDAWGERYYRKRYVTQDPIIRHVLTRTEPLRWSDVSSRVTDEAAEFGLRDGLTIVQHSIDGLRVCNSFAGERLDDDPATRAALLFISAAASSRAMMLASERTEAPVRLTQRERECLLWIVEGKTDWEIGMILGISENTVRVHANRLREKLHARTRTQAAVQAVRLGIIS